MNSAQPMVNVPMPAAAQTRRFGLFAARIGVMLSHKLGVAMPMTPPQYDNESKIVGALFARTTVQRPSRHYEMVTVQTAAGPRSYPSRALPGAVVVLPVQDITRLEPEFVSKVKWVCSHPECAGARFASKDELFQSHDENRKLIERAQQDPNGRAHMYYGVLEIAGNDAKVDDKTGKVLHPGSEPTVMLLSDEE